MRLPALLAALTLAGLAAGCAPAPTPTPTVAMQATPGPAPTADEAARRAVADLAVRLPAAPTAISVVSVEPQTWPDTSLGLPEPGQAYAQVLTSGYVVTLEYARQTYVYHVAGDTVRFNPQKSAPLPQGTAPPG